MFEDTKADTRNTGEGGDALGARSSSNEQDTRRAVLVEAWGWAEEPRAAGVRSFDESDRASTDASPPRSEVPRAGDVRSFDESDGAWIDQRLRKLARARAALDAEEAWLLRQAEAAKLWRAFGYASMLEYLERAVGYAPHTARERLRVAKALEDLPLMTEALASGQITQSAARELTRVASCGTEAAWLAAVEGKCLREIEAAVAGKRPGSMPEDPSEPSLRKRRVVLELTPEALDLLRQGAARLSELHGHRLSQEETILAALRMALEPRDAGGVNRPAYQIAIKTCPDCKRSWQHGGGREREVGEEVVEQARCDAEHLGSLDVVAPERKTSTVTPRVREQVFARDGYTCQVPGCRRNHGLDIHHIVFQENGGGHELANLTLMCSHHHAALHHGKLVVQGRAPDGLVVTFLRGHAIESFEDLEDEEIDWLELARAAPPAAPSHVDPRGPAPAGGEGAPEATPWTAPSPVGPRMPAFAGDAREAATQTAPSPTGPSGPAPAGGEGAPEATPWAQPSPIGPHTPACAGSDAATPTSPPHAAPRGAAPVGGEGAPEATPWAAPSPVGPRAPALAGRDAATPTAPSHVDPRGPAPASGEGALEAAP